MVKAALLLLVTVGAAVASRAEADGARTEDLYLGDFSLDPDSDNRKTPAAPPAPAVKKQVHDHRHRDAAY